MNTDEDDVDSLPVNPPQPKRGHGGCGYGVCAQNHDNRGKCTHGVVRGRSQNNIILTISITIIIDR